MPRTSKTPRDPDPEENRDQPEEGAVLQPWPGWPGIPLHAGQRLGRRIVALDQVDSTNTLLKEAAERGAEEGLVILARRQRQGRGQRNRTWFSAPGKGLYLSVLLRPDWPAGNVSRLPVLGAVAAAETLERLGIRNPVIKPPNDVLLGERKMAGILAEPRLQDQRIRFAVLGLGINIAHEPDDFRSAALQDRATSCRMEGIEVGIPEAAGLLLQVLDRWYRDVLAAGFMPLREAWRRRGGDTFPAPSSGGPAG